MDSLFDGSHANQTKILPPHNFHDLMVINPLQGNYLESANLCQTIYEEELGFTLPPSSSEDNSREILYSNPQTRQEETGERNPTCF